MVNNRYTITNQRRASTGHAKAYIVLLGCLYLCTAFTRACINSNAHPKNDTYKPTAYHAPYKDSLDNHPVSRDYNNLDEGLLAKALQGEPDAMDRLVERGKRIDAKALFKPGSVRVAVVKNSKGSISLVLEYPRKNRLWCKKEPETGYITLMVASSVEPTLPPPSYAEATGTPAYITCIEQLIKHKADLSGLNRWGETPLTEVIKHGKGQNQLKIIEILLKAGAPPNGLNRKKQVPLDVVNQIQSIEDQQKIVNLLIAYRANPLRASMDATTQKCARKAIIGHLEKLCLDATSIEELTNIDRELPLFFNQKYNRPNRALSDKKAQTCIVCAKKETETTTIQIPSCGHYVHGSCLARSLIHTKAKGTIKWIPRPSYLYTHLCPCCKKAIAQAFIKDLHLFYEGIKFKHTALTFALRVAFAIPCATVIPGGFVLLAGLFWPMPDT